MHQNSSNIYLTNLLTMKNLEKTKKILIKKARYEYFRDLWLEFDIRELESYIDEIKKTKTQKKLDDITYSLFNY